MIPKVLLPPDAISEALESFMPGAIPDRGYNNSESLMFCLMELEAFLATRPTLANYYAYQAEKRAEDMVETLKLLASEIFKNIRDVELGVEDNEVYAASIAAYFDYQEKYLKVSSTVSDQLTKSYTWLTAYRNSIASRLLGPFVSTQASVAANAILSVIPTNISATEFTLSEDLSIEVDSGVGRLKYGSTFIPTNSLITAGSFVEGFKITEVRRDNFLVNTDTTFSTRSVANPFRQPLTPVYVFKSDSKRVMAERLLNSSLGLDTENYYIKRVIRGYGIKQQTRVPISADTVDFSDAVKVAARQVVDICNKWSCNFIPDFFIENGMDLTLLRGRKDATTSLLESIGNVATRIDSRRRYVR